MLSDELRNLRTLSPSLAKYVLVAERLKLYLADSPIEWDLNPHLQVERIAREVSGDVNAAGFACSEHDVVVYWLTDLVTPRP